MLAAEVFQRYFNVVVALWFQLFVFLAFVVVSALHLFDDVNHSFQLLILNIEFHDLLNFLKILLFTYCKRCSPLSMRRLILVSSRHGWEINWFKALKKFRRQLKMQKKKHKFNFEWSVWIEILTFLENSANRERLPHTLHIVILRSVWDISQAKWKMK